MEHMFDHILKALKGLANEGNATSSTTVATPATTVALSLEPVKNQ
jgi:hypothetical protein